MSFVTGTLQFFRFTKDPSTAKDLGVLGPIDNDKLFYAYDVILCDDLYL